MLSTTELKRQASLDNRRRRNREAMQRDKDHMDALRRDSSEPSGASGPNIVTDFRLGDSEWSHCGPSATFGGRSRTGEQTHETESKLQEQLGERVKEEDRIEGLLKEMARDQQVQERMYRQLCRENPVHLGLQLDFSLERATHVILTLRRQRALVDRVGFTGTQRVHLFGWTTLHRFQDEKLYYSFKKVFPNRSAAQMADRNWENEIKFVTYRSASEAATQQFHVVQKFNDDTYLVAREKQDPDNEGKVVRLLYLRFRLFEANGSYAVVTQSVPHERSMRCGSLEKIWANDVCMWNHFVPVIDEKGEEHCEIHLTGSSAIGDPRSVRTNVLETIMGLLRWENINVGPTLSLTQTSQSANLRPGENERSSLLELR